MAKADRVHSTPRRTASLRKAPTPPNLHSRTLERMYEKFDAAYRAFRTASTKTANKGSAADCTPAQKAAHRKWERRLIAVENIVKQIIAAPAFSVDAALMKIHVSGFLTDGAVDFTWPYGPENPQGWKISETYGSETKTRLIVSLRSDLWAIRRSLDLHER
jgi:hypothetical protein